ncbi:hypothetical protein, partial [Mannheimia haemolytica]|uniref:hypothetical protein n=1 Tax=Mannheimia haemolytica TaxID=75985 RepID=UPI001EE3408F
PSVAPLPTSRNSTSIESPQGDTNISSLLAGLFNTPTKLLASTLCAGILSLLHPLFYFLNDMLVAFIEYL